MADFFSLTRRALLRYAALALPAAVALPRLAAGASAPSLTPPPETPEPARSPHPRKVLILGAGLAGLSAAYELDARGHDVTVLEAQVRPGGRVHTLRNFADGLHVEAGAMDFSDGYQNLKRYLKIFKIAAVPPPDENLATVLYARGRRIVTQPGKGREQTYPFAFTPEEKQLGVVGMFEKYLLDPLGDLGDPTRPDWSLESCKRFDDVTMYQFLKNQGASDEAISFMSLCAAIGYGWSTGSALHRIVSDILLLARNPNPYFIAGGADSLPRAFARALKERIHYGVPVTRIVQEGGKVRAVFRQGGTEQSMEADHLVCTAPCPILRTLEFTPDLPARKRQIFENLEYLPVTRIFVQVRRRIWLDEGVAGSAGTDLPIGLVGEHPVPRLTDSPRAVLECLIRGSRAVPVGTWEPARQMDFAVENLDKVHPGFPRHAEDGITVSWQSNPWAGGAYAWWKPGQITSWVPELAKAEGRVHFAGEHTSALGRTMEGALVSGNRVAREIDAAES